MSSSFKINKNLANILYTLFLLNFKFFAYGIEIPNGLEKKDRVEITRLLGLGTSEKILSNPFPLGGYDGLEVSTSIELINTSDLHRFGNGSTSEQSNFRYPKISFGKGLYNNIDLFFDFVPFSEDSRLSFYGGMFRWSFFQADNLPINASILLHGSILNLNDSFESETLGSEFIAGISVNDFSIYFGGGFLQSSSSFLASGPNSLVVSTDAANSNGKINERIFENHSLVGITFHFSNIFLALQIDRYFEPVYSCKLGLRL